MIIELWCITSVEEKGSPTVYWNGEFFGEPIHPNLMLFPTLGHAQATMARLMSSEGMCGQKINSQQLWVSFEKATIVNPEIL